jgi:HK97 family phage prohead protease
MTDRNYLADTIAHGLEVRYINPQVEIRENTTDGTIEFRGYATVYNEWYDVAGGPDLGGWREQIVAGSGARTLNARPDVRLLINHEGLALARTSRGSTVGTLNLAEDARGLLCFAPALDLRNPKVQEVRSTMERGDVDAMSYAFRATRQEWNADYTERRILEYALDVEGSDVSIVTYPANRATIATIRSAAKIDELRTAHPTTSSLTLDMAFAMRDQIRRRA